MDKNTILMILVIFLMIFSIATPIFFYTKTLEYSQQKIGGRTVASVSVFVPAECGDSLCELDETCASCPGDCGTCVCGDWNCDANETCVTCPIDCGECVSIGGETGGRVITKPYFEFDPWSFEEDLTPGDYISRTASLRNLGRYTEIHLSLERLKDFIKLNKNKLWLGKNSLEYFILEINISSNTSPGIYIGQVEAFADDVREILPITLNIREIESKLKVYVMLLSERALYKPNEMIQGEISIVNLGIDGFADASFYLSDLNNNRVYENYKKLYLNEGNNMFYEDFRIPSEIEPGYYLFFTEIIFNDNKYADARLFRIESPIEQVGIIQEKYMDYLQIIVFFILLGLMVYFMRKFSKKQRKKKR